MKWCSVGNNGKILTVGNCPVGSPPEAFAHITGLVIIDIPEDITFNSHYYDDGFHTISESPGENYEFNYMIKGWELNLEGYKQAAINTVNKARDSTLATGIEYSGKSIDLKPASLTVLYATIEVARASDNEFSVDWIAADNSILTLSRADLLSLSFIIQEFTSEQVIKCRTLKDAIIAATTKEEVDAVVW
jgi:hypothetical protein